MEYLQGLCKRKSYSSQKVLTSNSIAAAVRVRELEGFHSVESVKIGCETLLQVLTEQKCKHVLNDNRMVSGPWMGVADWVATDWFPRVYATGVEKFAWIVSANIFSQMSTEATQAKNKNDKTRTFDDVAKAASWLGIK
jgi:hypothetical protein